MDNQLIGKLLMVELEIMDLYKEEFNLDPRGNVEYKRYTRDEQVERYAKNAAFRDRLYIKHCSHDVLFRLSLYLKFRDDKHLLEEIINKSKDYI